MIKKKEPEIRYQDNSIDTRDFWYKVKSYYESSYPHNYILCKIIPNGSVDCYETKIYFTFGIKGTSGTKYTLAIANKTSQSALINTGTGENKLELDISLRDVNNE